MHDAPGLFDVLTVCIAVAAFLWQMGTDPLPTGLAFPIGFACLLAAAFIAGRWVKRSPLRAISRSLLFVVVSVVVVVPAVLVPSPDERAIATAERRVCTEGLSVVERYMTSINTAFATDGYRTPSSHVFSGPGWQAAVDASSRAVTAASALPANHKIKEAAAAIQVVAFAIQERRGSEGRYGQNLMSELVDGVIELEASCAQAGVADPVVLYRAQPEDTCRESLKAHQALADISLEDEQNYPEIAKLKLPVVKAAVAEGASEGPIAGLAMDWWVLLTDAVVALSPSVRQASQDAIPDAWAGLANACQFDSSS